MPKILSDHQDSNYFTYSRNWIDIESMLDKAERLQNIWVIKLEKYKSKKNKQQMIKCVRNIKALEGVIKTLRWTLGDKDIPHPLN